MFCPKCGTNVDDSFNFCFKCGFDFSIMKQMAGTTEQASATTVSKQVQQVVNSQNVINDNCGDEKEDCGERRNCKYNFEAFNGTQERYESMYNNLCYEQKEYEQLYYFVSYVNDTYQDNEFKSDYALYTPPGMFWLGKMVYDSNIVEALCDYGYEEKCQTLLELIDDANALVNFAFWYGLIGKRDYAFSEYLYIRDKDYMKYDSLKQSLEQVSNDYQRKSIENELKIYEDKYDKWSYETHILKCLKIIDVEHILIDIEEYAGKNSTYVSDLYSVILDNAIEWHDADYLKGKYPTKQESAQIASLVRNGIVNSYRKATNNIPMVIQRMNECKRLANMINDLEDKVSDSSLLKKGALTVGLTLISGPLGILNGIREGYNAYEASEKIDKLREELKAAADEFFDEYDKLLVKCWDANKEVGDLLDEHIGKQRFLPALKFVFEQLNNNKVKIRSLEKYLEQ